MDEPINIYKLITSTDNRKRNEGFILLYEDETLNNFVKSRLVGLDDVELHDLLVDGIEALQISILEKRYRGEGAVQTYLYKIYDNKIIDIIRKKKRRKTDSWDEIPEGKIKKGEEEEEQKRLDQIKERHEMLWKDIEKLKPNCQELIRNRFMEGLDNGEIVEFGDLANKHQVAKAVGRCLEYLRRITSENPFYKK